MTLFVLDCFVERGGRLPRHGVKTAFMPGVTAANPTSTQPQTFEQAVYLDGFPGIVGATGIKATTWTRQEAKAILINNN
jgi:hypothetical protein